MGAFRWCIAHTNSMCACRVINIQNICHTWVILMTIHLHPKIRVNTWIFWNFSSQVNIRYLRLIFKFLQQLNDYSENNLVLKLFDYFLVSCYASLTTKNSHFVWSITLWNLRQFQKNLYCWNQQSAWKVLSAY